MAWHIIFDSKQNAIVKNKKYIFQIKTNYFSNY
jgi:hypothetical protein